MVEGEPLFVLDDWKFAFQVSIHGIRKGHASLEFGHEIIHQTVNFVLADQTLEHCAFSGFFPDFTTRAHILESAAKVSIVVGGHCDCSDRPVHLADLARPLWRR